MKVFLAGATGFVGRHILNALLADGHTVRAAVRRPEKQKTVPGVEWVQGDFSVDHEPVVWTERLKGCEALVNAVGIIRETKNQSFLNLHYRGPLALFAAAKKLKVRSVIQISALGADESASTAYHVTKKKCDDDLRANIPGAVILQPSLIAGPGGKSTAMFAFMAALPVVFLPGRGDQKLQPLDVRDLASGVVSILRSRKTAGAVLKVTGPEVLTFKELVSGIRSACGLSPAFAIHIPIFLIRIVARLAAGILDRETLSMLEKGNTGDHREFEKRTGVSMKSVFAPWLEHTMPDVRFTVLPYGLVLLKLGLAVVWIWTGIVSAFFSSRAENYRLLSIAGVPEVLLPWALYGASLLDAVLGFFMFTRFAAASYLFQFALVLYYSTVLSVQIPELWLEPFGPLSKNLPILTGTLILFIMDQRKKCISG